MESSTKPIRCDECRRQGYELTYSWKQWLCPGCLGRANSSIKALIHKFNSTSNKDRC